MDECSENDKRVKNAMTIHMKHIRRRVLHRTENSRHLSNRTKNSRYLANHRKKFRMMCAIDSWMNRMEGDTK